jgi:predicted N-formylglutamate amidohydrolase
MSLTLILSCEHGGNRIPPRYAALFRGAKRALESHRGYDPGSLELARLMARQLRAPLVYSTVSRLLIELNRSPGHPRLFSEFSRPLDPAAREELVQRYYLPYRRRVTALVEEALRRGGRVLHVGVHTFTPDFEGVRRTADVALLYDPARRFERNVADRWLAALRRLRPDLELRRNYPYRGTSDGLTTILRRHFGPRYAGIELEVNQSWPMRSACRALQRNLALSLGVACHTFTPTQAHGLIPRDATAIR